MVTGGNKLAIGSIGGKPLKKFNLQWFIGGPGRSQVA